jgi:hypothetical protein
MGPNHNKIVSWWQLRMFIIGLPDKMLTDLRNSKGSRRLSAVWMDSLVRGVNHSVLNLVFSLCMSKCLAKVQDSAMSLLHCFPSSYFLQRQSSPGRLTNHCLMQLQAVNTFANLVLYHLWLYKIILKPTMHFFLHSAHLRGVAEK